MQVKESENVGAAKWVFRRQLAGRSVQDLPQFRLMRLQRQRKGHFTSYEQR